MKVGSLGLTFAALLTHSPQPMLALMRNTERLTKTNNTRKIHTISRCAVDRIEIYISCRSTQRNLSVDRRMIRPTARCCQFIMRRKARVTTMPNNLGFGDSADT